MRLIFVTFIRGATMNNGGLINRLFAAIAIIYFINLLCVIPAFGAEPTIAENDALQRQAIEDYYQKLISEIQFRADLAVREINDTGHIERSNAETVRRTRLADDFHQERSDQLLSDDELNEMEQQRAQSEKDIRARTQSEIDYLKQRKARELENIGKPFDPRSLVSIQTRGTLNGIVFYENKGAALILGQIVYENDEIENARVVKIWPDYVEFEKQGKKWKQEVGQTPPAMVWEKPQPKSPAHNPKTSR